MLETLGYDSELTDGAAMQYSIHREQNCQDREYFAYGMCALFKAFYDCAKAKFDNLQRLQFKISDEQIRINATVGYNY